MRLKVPPKEALRLIDILIQRGSPLYDPLASNRDFPSIIATKFIGLNAWYITAEATLRLIFADYTPIYKFSKNIQKFISDIKKNNGMETSKADYNNILLSLDTLATYYDQLLKEVQSVLFYIHDKAQICFYSAICQLLPSSNEASLCKFLFENFSFNQFVEMELIYEKAFGGDSEKYDRKCAEKVKNAFNGINEKTNDSFGFPIVKKKKTLLALTIPSRFLAPIN